MRKLDKVGHDSVRVTLGRAHCHIAREWQAALELTSAPGLFPPHAAVTSLRAEQRGFKEVT